MSLRHRPIGTTPQGLAGNDTALRPKLNRDRLRGMMP